MSSTAAAILESLARVPSVTGAEGAVGAGWTRGPGDVGAGAHRPDESSTSPRSKPRAKSARACC